MTKFDKEFISQIEEAIKFLENTKILHPGMSDNRVKQIKEKVAKLIKKNDESKD